MKLRNLFVVISLAVAARLTAVPAYKQAVTIQQADGTTITITLYGDEHHHWTATNDGTIVMNTRKGCFVAEIDEQGVLHATDILAHEPTQRSTREQQAIETQKGRKEIFFRLGEERIANSRRAMSISGTGYFPSKDTPKCLTILAQFSDVKFTINEPQKAFDNYLNKETQEDLGNGNLNINSVINYFKACSRELFQPQFDVVGPVTLPQTKEYYGKNDSSGHDQNFSTFCDDALNAVKEAYPDLDWTQYDNDGNGSVELVTIIYAGYGENHTGADTNTIWPKATNLGKQVTGFSGISKINYANCSQELDGTSGTNINGTGTFIHEMSHCMGLPDLYQTYKPYYDNQTMNRWSVMDVGCFRTSGGVSYPAPYTAWEQEALGWIEIEALTEPRQVKNLKPIIEGGKAYKIVNSDNNNDYIVLESIQKQGIGIGAPISGLLAYHVAYRSNKVTMTDAPNNKKDYPAVAVIPSGGDAMNEYNVDTDDQASVNRYTQSCVKTPFPGKGDVTTLTDEQLLPNYTFYNSTTNPTAKKQVGHSLYNIVQDKETHSVSFDYDMDGTAGIEAITIAGDNDAKEATYYDLQGRRIQRLSKGIYISNGRKVMVR